MAMIWILEIILLNVDLTSMLIVESDIVFLGKEKFKEIKKNGVKRRLMGVKINCPAINITEWIPM